MFRQLPFAISWCGSDGPFEKRIVGLSLRDRPGLRPSQRETRLGGVCTCSQEKPLLSIRVVVGRTIAASPPPPYRRPGSQAEPFLDRGDQLLAELRFHLLTVAAPVLPAMWATMLRSSRSISSSVIVSPWFQQLCLCQPHGIEVVRTGTGPARHGVSPWSPGFDPSLQKLNQSQSGIYIDTGMGSAVNTVIPANAGIQGTVQNVL